MTEAEAIEWLAQRWPERMPMLTRFVALLRGEAALQNLIAPSTFATIWARHIADSAQLLPLAKDRTGLWIDIGSGGGLPGIVVAILRDAPILLVEPRRRRVDFLRQCIGTLSLSQANVFGGRIETIHDTLAMVISARAVAPVDTILAATDQIVSRETIFLLPRGQSGREELARAQTKWHGTFHVKQSITSPVSTILVAQGVTAR